MQHFANISNKVIQIGVQPSFSTVVLDKVLPVFRKTYPDMKIVLQEYSAANLMEMLRRQEVDVILATTDKRDSDYEYQLVKSCETVIAVEKNHPLIMQTIWREGFRYPWIALSKCFAANPEGAPELAKLWCLFRKILQFGGKWPRCRGPPSESLKT